MAHTPAQPRYCPGCGGPNPLASATACRFCEGPLVPLGSPDPRLSIRCPSCASAVGQGASFCDQCGHGLAGTDAAPSPHTCSGCAASPMDAFGLAPTANRPQGNPVHGCRRCGGVWIDAQTLKRLLAAAAAEVFANSAPTRPASVHQRRMASTKVVYRRCAVCSQHMQRRNFARVSGVIVDECRTHGSFFDAGELEDVLAFVRSGGLRLAAEREADEKAREARQRASMPAPNPMRGMGASDTALDMTIGIDEVGAFVRWARRWIFGR